MASIRFSIRDGEWKHSQSNNQKLDIDDTYGCVSCSYPIEILEIDIEKNTLTFRCLNPIDKKPIKTITISEYLDSMKKYTYLYSECSLCNKKQNEFKDSSIFSYCTKCDVVICSDCIDKHLKTNKKNHLDLNLEYIIANNEKNIKCLLHPQEKNLAFCFNCNTHICKKCLKSQKHINHTKNNLLEVSVSSKIKKSLNNIINIYENRIIQLNKEKDKIEKNLFNEKQNNKKQKQKQTEDKIKEVNKKL